MSDIFEQNDQDAQPAPAATLEELVGEGRKFKTVEDLAKSKIEADAFIEKLKEENAEYRKLYEAKESEGNAKALSELIETLKANKETPGESEGDNQTPQEDLVKLILDTVEGRDSERTRSENRRKASELVLQKFNGDAEASKAFVAEKAKELGMSPKDLTSLSERSPQAFAQLVDVKPTATSPSSASISNSVNTQAPNLDRPMQKVVGGVPHNTKAFYDARRKEMGAWKYLNDTKLQHQYMKDAMALGDEFNT